MGRISWRCVLVSWAVLVGCSDGTHASAGGLDELDRSSQGSFVFAVDGGSVWWSTGDLEPAIEPHVEVSSEEDLATGTPGCHDACPAVCSPDEACCASLQLCVSLDCPSCCPDPDFGIQAIWSAMK